METLRVGVKKLSKNMKKNTIARSPKDLDRPQWWRDWEANEWIYECFTCLHYKAYAPTRKKIKAQAKLHAKDCLGGWA